MVAVLWCILYLAAQSEVNLLCPCPDYFEIAEDQYAVKALDQTFENVIVRSRHRFTPVRNSKSTALPVDSSPRAVLLLLASIRPGRIRLCIAAAISGGFAMSPLGAKAFLPYPDELEIEVVQRRTLQ